MTTSKSLKFIDFDKGWFLQLAAELGHPVTGADGESKYHRKVWEFCVVCDTFNHFFKPGSIDVDSGHGVKALGFGVGLEPIALWLASAGADVLATDLQLTTDAQVTNWRDTGQNANSLDDILKHNRDRVQCRNDPHGYLNFQHLDMRNIPYKLRRQQFDFAWSAGTLEHIGGKAAGLQFLIQQMQCLRPGGVAAYTTEYDYTGNDVKVETDDLCLYTEADLKSIVNTLRSRGYDVWPLDLQHPLFEAPPEAGDSNDPEAMYHLKYDLCGTSTTSVLLVVQKPAKCVDKRGRPLPQVSNINGTSDSKPSMLFVGDAVVSTGFASCTHAVCDHLHSVGWDVSVLGLNYHGDPHSYPYTIYPAIQPLDGGRDAFGVGRLGRLAGRLKPDIIVLLNDPWNIPAYLRALQKAQCSVPPVVGWLAVDAKNQNGVELAGLDKIVAWTEFGRRALLDGGYGLNDEGELLSPIAPDIDIVPLGVDTSVFYPVDRDTARAAIFGDLVPHDSFVFGVVGRNQIRKRIDLSIKYFAKFVVESNANNAVLYIHAAPTGEKCCDVVSLVRYYGLHGKVIFAEPSDGGHGVDVSSMRNLYNAMDVYFTTTAGEGWGLCALEAMACGVPVVAPDWSGLGCWAKDAAALVPCTSTVLNAPMYSQQGPYTVGGVADRGFAVHVLCDLYGDSADSANYRGTLRAKGAALAQQYQWYKVGPMFEKVLNGVLGIKQ